ncbi:MAG: TonB-dependent receptor, partial [Sphingomonadaceae bacterium]
PPPGKAKVNKVTFKAALDYQATDDVLLYASFSRGYRSGIFNILTYNTDVPTKPEGLDAYEVGIKSDLFDKRVRINAAAFYYDISNPQVQLIRNGTVFFSNAGSSRVKGAEIEAQALIFEGFTTRASATYLDSKYKTYIDAPFSIPDQVNGGAIGLPNGDARGNRTPLAAKFVFNLGADYTVPLAGGELTFTADYYHNSGYYYEPDNFLYQPSYDLLSGQIKFAPTENYAIRVWGKNLTGEKYTIAAATQVGQSGYPWTPAKPRTYGIAVDFNF